MEDKLGGKRTLGDCDGYMDWPDLGVYFFFEPNETRAKSEDLRVTRVGTHAVSTGSTTMLWNRLRQHRGPLSGKYSGGGNHRGSIFRLHVGEALIKRDGLEQYSEWGKGSSSKPELREKEHNLEKKVSAYIRSLPFLWVEVDDPPGPDSRRAYIERNSIALLSNYKKGEIDSRPDNWLGKYSPNSEIQESGLWNLDHITEQYDPKFLESLERNVKDMKGSEQTRLTR